MDAELRPSPRDYYESKYPHCPNCGRYNPKRQNSFVVSPTGSYVRNKEVGCRNAIIIFFATYFVTAIVVTLMIGIILNITGKGFDPLYGDTTLVAIPFGFIGASIAVLLYYSLKQIWSNKTNITVTHCVCKYCKKEWDAVQ